MHCILRHLLNDVCRCFFFNYTATTEIYSNSHTLSLPRALPIWAPGRLRGRLRRAGGRERRSKAEGRRGPAAGEHSLPRRRGGERSGLRQAARSDEHTSELQSLMRISYAVFLLKKKSATSRYTNYRNLSYVLQSYQTQMSA